MTETQAIILMDPDDAPVDYAPYQSLEEARVDAKNHEGAMLLVPAASYDAAVAECGRLQRIENELRNLRDKWDREEKSLTGRYIDDRSVKVTLMTHVDELDAVLEGK